MQGIQRITLVTNTHKAMAKKLKEFTVKWEIQISSTKKENAARQALQIMRDKKSTATVMSVVEFDNTADEPEEFDLLEN